MNLLRRILAAGAVLAASVCLSAQSGPLPVDQIVHDGSPGQKEVHAVLLDRTGYLWIGTQQGLARYDGYRVVPFRINGRGNAGLPVRAICQAPDGRLWLATSGGLARFDPQTGASELFSHSAVRSDTIGADELTCLHEAAAMPGKMWIASAAGTLDELDLGSGRIRRRIPKAGASQAPRPGPIRALGSDPAGVLWIGAGNGLFRFLPREDSLKFDPLPPPESSAGPIPTRDVRAIFCNPAAADTLWLGSDGAGLLRFGPTSGVWERCSENAAHANPGGVESIVNAIAPFPGDDKKLLLGTESGLFGYEPASQRCRNLPLLVDDKVIQAVRVIQTIYRDPQGNYWIGSRGEGLCKWSPLRKPFRHHLLFDEGDRPGVLKAPLPNPLANWVTSMLELNADEILLTTYGGGVWVFDRRGRPLRRLVLDPRQPARRLNAFISDSRRGPDGGLWFLTAEGLARCTAAGRLVELRAITRDKAEAEAIFAFTFILDRRNFAWIATDRGLVRLGLSDGSLRRYRHERHDPRSLGHDRVNSILEESGGAIWAGTDDGLSLYQPQDDRFVVYRSDGADPQSLASSQINFLARDSQGRTWVCTSGGLERLEKKDGRVVFRHFPVPGGDPGQNLIRCLAEESPRRLWVGTSAGLARFDSERGSFTFYDRRDGVSAEGLGEAFFGMRSRDDEMFFGGRLGFFRFRSAEIALNLHPPPLVTTGYRFYGSREAAAAGDLNSFLPPAQDVPGNMLVRIEFAALDFVRPEKNQYAYRLEGRDPDWIYQGTKRVVDLEGLPIGTHTLHIKAANNEGVWNEGGESVPINVRLSPWEQWRIPMLAALLAAAAAAAILASRRRAKRLQRAAIPDHLDLVLERFSISKREAEIVRLLLAGKSNKEIENELFIAMATVKIHVHNIFRKVKVGNRLQLLLRIQQESKRIG